MLCMEPPRKRRLFRRGLRKRLQAEEGAVMSREEEHVKKRILKAAKTLTALKGFEATTVREICTKADANLSLVSYYYGGKEHVFESMLDAFILIGTASEVLASRQPEPVAGVCTMVREILSFHRYDPEISRIIHQELTRETPRTEIVRARVMPGWLLMRRYLEEGRTLGEFHFRSLDMVLVQAMGSILFGGVRSGLPVKQENLDEEAQLGDVLNFILGGIGYTGEARFAGEPIIPGLVPTCAQQHVEESGMAGREPQS
ncbi:hypothetical protein B9G55_14815 [Saccharibacillus sp. O16]|nr:hypothetical protein B9G55_14815 [Saccharibacillus sp. O16]